jgi:hypothetical protein
MLDATSSVRLTSIRRRLRSSVGLILLAAARLAVANPEQSDTVPACPFSEPEHARLLADRSVEQGAYQRAGECYKVAGDYDRANSAFIEASRVAARASSRQLAQDRDQAKAQWQRLQAALHRKR